VRYSMVEHNQSSYYNNGYKFNGKELDEATGMYYYGARYYDPRISIFISVDPLAEQTMTPYQYVHNNPVNLIDPTGMSADGWGLKDGTWEYKNEITKDNFKKLGYEKYMESGNVYSTTNDVADGEYNYSLNSDGTVNNSYGRSMNESFTTARGTNIKIDKDGKGLGMYDTFDNILSTLDLVATLVETSKESTKFTQGLGLAATFAGPYISYKKNLSEYNLGLIDKDRYSFRNVKITSNVISSTIMGRYHPAIGYSSGKLSDTFFDGLEFGADYLNNGFNQMKNQIIFNISNN